MDSILNPRTVSKRLKNRVRDREELRNAACIVGRSPAQLVFPMLAVLWYFTWPFTDLPKVRRCCGDLW